MEPQDKSLEDLQAEHGGPVAKRHRVPRGELEEQSPVRNYVRDMVLGFNDGLVSVYAVTAGLVGAAFAGPQILLAGIAAAVAGALSMAAGEYISTKSQAQYYAAERRREEEHLRRWPELEKREVRESLAEKGIDPPLLDEVTEAIAADPDRMLDFMMREEFGLGVESERDPWKAAWIVILAFLVGAMFALVPYGVLDGEAALAGSSALSVTGLFLAGALRARASHLPVVKAGLEMVLIGIAAAAATYGLGVLVGGAL